MTTYPNWFQNDGAKNFENILMPALGEKSQSRMLQIGAYTGDASVWLYENILQKTNSVLVDVDTWMGSDEVVHKEMNWQTVESLYDTKTKEARKNLNVVKFKTTSDWFFKNNLEFYDFIYIDGDHTSYGVIKDAVSAYEWLKKGGILGFDDYDWRGGTGPLDRPKAAIDAFLHIYGDRVEVIKKDYQCWVRKVS